MGNLHKIKIEVVFPGASFLSLILDVLYQEDEKTSSPTNVSSTLSSLETLPI